MVRAKILRLTVIATLILSVSACGERGPFAGGNEGGFERDFDSPRRTNQERNGRSVFDLFSTRDDPNTTLEVNKYLWSASLDVLSFMPIEAADPFTGTIVMGYGRPQGGGPAYRATVFISDPALDARALRVSLQDINGRAVGSETQRAVENAILTRARQIRVRDTGL